MTLVKVPLDAVQVTPSLVGSFCTTAENFKVCEVVMPPRLGDRVTLRLAGIANTVISALPNDLRSVTEVAVIVTVAGLGAFAGAVYVMGAPDALVELESVPQRAPAQPEPESVHVTPLLWGSF